MKTITGKVVSNKMSKTVIVELFRQYKHPVYKKILKRTIHIKAHTNDTSIKEGNIVKIVQTRPISKDKHYKVVEKVS